MEAREIGLLGPAPVEDHIAHSFAFADVVLATTEPPPSDLPQEAVRAPTRILDLGSGAGVPGLVLAAVRPTVAVILLEASEKRADWLLRTAAALTLDNLTVARGRAEELGRRPELRASIDCVTARAFGPPAVVLECGAPFLKIGGRLVVSEPPNSDESPIVRWPAEGLDTFGAGAATYATRADRGFVTVPQRRVCPDRFPRRTGIPQKRPLF